MKNTIILIMIFLSYTNLHAFYYNSMKHKISKFVELKQGYSFIEKRKVLDKEPLSNIVGGNSKNTTLILGLSGELNNHISNSTRNMRHVKAYVYLSRYDEAKYNELIFGVGARISTDMYYDIFKIDFDFAAGLGSQDNKGKKLKLDSNANTVNYVLNKTKTGSYTGTYTQDTNVFEINIGIGSTFKTGIDNLLIRTAYQYHYKNYEFQYKIEGEQQYMDLGGVIQDNHEFSVSVLYKF